MDAFGPINKLGATLGASALAASQLSGKKSQPKQETTPSANDLKMAQKARRNAQLKIKAIIENKEISRKAMTRRVGKVLDEYKGGSK